MSGAQLDALAGQADQLDAAAQGADDAPQGQQQLPSDPPPEPTRPGNFEALAFILAGFREVSCAMLKVDSPRHTLDDANVERCARVLAPVADKYGLDLGSYLGGPEAAAIMVAGPILWRAYRALDEELAARKRKPAGEGDQVEGAAAAAPAGPNG